MSKVQFGKWLIDVQKCKTLNFSEKKTNSRKLQLKAKRNCWHIQFPTSKHKKKDFEEIFYWTNRNFLSKSRKRRKWSFVVLQNVRLLKELESNSVLFVGNYSSHFKQLHSHSFHPKNIPTEVSNESTLKNKYSHRNFCWQVWNLPFFIKCDKKGL